MADSLVALVADRVAVIEDLKKLADGGVAIDAFGLLPAHADLVARAVDIFGSLGAARRAAGLRRGTPITRDSDPVTMLHDLAARGVRLTPHDLRQLGEDAVLKLCYARFGGWPNARAAAGLEAPPRLQAEMPTAEEVLDAIRERARGVEALFARDLDRDVARAARHHFRGVIKAIDAAGVTRLKPNARWTPDLLIDELARRLAKGRPVTITSLLAERRADIVSAIQRHFDSFSTAAAIAAQQVGTGSWSRIHRTPPRAPRRIPAPKIPNLKPLVQRLVRAILEVATRHAQAVIDEEMRHVRATPTRRAKRIRRRRHAV